MELGSRDAFAGWRPSASKRSSTSSMPTAARPRGLTISSTAAIRRRKSRRVRPRAVQVHHREAQTELIEDPSNAVDALSTVRAALVDHAAADGYRIAAAGLHPAAKWRELEHAEKPRYQAQLDRIQYPQHRNTTAGLHVHVARRRRGQGRLDRQPTPVALPVLLALSANSPFWNGFDTGLASARAKIFENLPNTGIPSAFDDFDAFQRYERRMVERGSIADRGELWFDVRPHTGHGTVEVRAPDAQRDPGVTLAFVEYVHARRRRLRRALRGRRVPADPPPGAVRREQVAGDPPRSRRLLHHSRRRGHGLARRGRRRRVRPPRNRRDPRRVRRREREPAPAPTPRGGGRSRALCDDLMLSP